MRRLRRTLVPLLAVALLAHGIRRGGRRGQIPAPRRSAAGVGAAGQPSADARGGHRAATGDFSTGATIDFIDNDTALPIDGCDDVAVDAGNATSCTINDPGGRDATISRRRTRATRTSTRPRARSSTSRSSRTRSTPRRRPQLLDVLPGQGRLPRHAHDLRRPREQISGHDPDLQLEPTSKVKQIPCRSAAATTRHAGTAGTAPARSSPPGKYQIVQTPDGAAGTQGLHELHQPLEEEARHEDRLGDQGRRQDRVLADERIGHRPPQLGRHAAPQGRRRGDPGGLVVQDAEQRHRQVGDVLRSTARRRPWSRPPSSGSRTSTTAPAVIGCFSRTKNIGTASGTKRWYTISGSAAYLSSGQTIHAIAVVDTGSVDIYKVKAT